MEMEANYHKGMQYFNRGEYENALPYFEGNDVLSKSMKGITLRHLNDWDGANKSLEEALEMPIKFKSNYTLAERCKRALKEFGRGFIAGSDFIPTVIEYRKLKKKWTKNGSIPYSEHLSKEDFENHKPVTLGAKAVKNYHSKDFELENGEAGMFLGGAMCGVVLGHLLAVPSLTMALANSVTLTKRTIKEKYAA